MLPDEILSVLIEEGCIAVVGEKDKGTRINEEEWTKIFCDSKQEELRKWVDAWTFWEYLSPLRQVKTEVTFYSVFDNSKKEEFKNFIKQQEDELKVAKTNIKVYEKVKSKYKMDNLN